MMSARYHTALRHVSQDWLGKVSRTCGSVEGNVTRWTATLQAVDRADAQVDVIIDGSRRLPDNGDDTCRDDAEAADVTWTVMTGNLDALQNGAEIEDADPGGAPVRLRMDVGPH